MLKKCNLNSTNSDSMKLLKKLFFVIISIAAILLILALFVEKEFTVQRNITISKSSSEVFNYLKYIKNQDEWSVWQKMDPDMKKYYKGEDGKIGFVSSWKSKNENVGSGDQELTLLKYPERIETELRFKEPFEKTNYAFFNLVEKGSNSTEVTWGFNGKMSWPTNILLLFMNMEDQIGPDLEQGLNNLKKQLEDV